MVKFASEFNTLRYVIERSKTFLLVAHSHPDADTAGSVLALREYLVGLGKSVTVACSDPFPKYLEEFNSAESFEFIQKTDVSLFDTVIACDSVERGFHKISSQILEKQVVVLIDHHPDITIQGDINIVDAEYSSVCEIIFDLFSFLNITITKNMATLLLLGILGDTGVFQNANTTSRVMVVTSELVRRGASLPKVVELTFANKKISTLRLWGKAFEKAKINPKNGMIATVITQKDMAECEATSDDVAQVASILNTVPGTKFSLILSERDNGIVKGSLRSEKYKGADVSEIAHAFGGGGHKLASGFEIKGRIVETENGWKII